MARLINKTITDTQDPFSGTDNVLIKTIYRLLRNHTHDKFETEDCRKALETYNYSPRDIVRGR